jgi:maltose alpha-D-glucosyltransferase/alpha-amylase
MAGSDRDDLIWYKDAVFYAVYVRTFLDSNGDGVGDFVGLTSRLDYLQWLGVTAIWVLPMYPSPLKDGGYDIADYFGILPDYGTLEDFKTFLDAAHDRGIRVITDLVINHTSDQHPWFRESRSSRHHPKRDWYVWSDTDQKYQGVRIIFSDTETSNWAWDDHTQQYYWHRFYSHQPDLNFDNPEVQDAIIQVASFWANLGVDGFRVDAATYLYEREGTTCDNLPETHAYIQRLRAHLDQQHPGTLLLAEANLWPEQLVEYFSTGNEFQMAYHFPVMPRLYLALAQGDTHAIYDILRRTPAIPDNCQWGVFLRNHDELTLEMVTDEEREAMYAAYAPDRRMRFGLGVRRRLAPMMRDNPQKILLMHAVILGLKGTPFLYYGDEIGMGDLVFLHDRNGVRTPMQWSPDRNAGFSPAEAYRLPFPVIDDPVFGYRRVNVEDEQRNEDSLLYQIRQLIQVRQRHPAFGRGSLDLIGTDHPSVLAFIRRLGGFNGAAMLVACNFSGFSRCVHLDLHEFAGDAPVDAVHGATWDPIRGDATPVVLPPYGFLWLRLRP